jgi:uncharacterized NAD(P)/FAD-binding protein YdhS
MLELPGMYPMAMAMAGAMTPALPRDARVLFLGTGPGTAELALALISRGHQGKLVALSESGLLHDLDPDAASKLHEIVAWHRLELKAGRVLRVKRLMKGERVRAVRVEYFSNDLGTPAKLETDWVIDCEVRVCS